MFFPDFHSFVAKKTHHPSSSSSSSSSRHAIFVSGVLFIIFVL